MQYLNLAKAVLDGAVLRQASAEARSTWLNLLSYCIGQENGGWIAGARAWTDEMCMMSIGIRRAALEVESELWTWEGEDLNVTFYPVEQEQAHLKKRTGGKLGGIIRQRQLKAHRKAPVQAMPEAMPEPKAEASGQASPERKGKERKEKECKEREVRPPFSGCESNGGAMPDALEDKKTAPLEISDAALAVMCRRMSVPVSYGRYWRTKLATRKEEVLLRVAMNPESDLSAWWQECSLTEQEEWHQKNRAEKTAPPGASNPKIMTGLFEQMRRQRDGDESLEVAR